MSASAAVWPRLSVACCANWGRASGAVRDHLPQVAAQADWQWQVSKATRNGVTLKCHSAVDDAGRVRKSPACWAVWKIPTSPPAQRTTAQTSLKSRKRRAGAASSQQGQGGKNTADAVYQCWQQLVQQAAPSANAQHGGRGQRQRWGGRSIGCAAHAGDGDLRLVAELGQGKSSRGRKWWRRCRAPAFLDLLVVIVPRSAATGCRKGEEQGDRRGDNHAGNQGAAAATEQREQVGDRKALMAPTTTNRPRWRAARVMQTSWLLSPEFSQHDQQIGYWPTTTRSPPRRWQIRKQGGNSGFLGAAIDATTVDGWGVILDREPVLRQRLFWRFLDLRVRKFLDLTAFDCAYQMVVGALWLTSNLRPCRIRRNGVRAGQSCSNWSALPDKRWPGDVPCSRRSASGERPRQIMWRWVLFSEEFGRFSVREM